MKRWLALLMLLAGTSRAEPKRDILWVETAPGLFGWMRSQRGNDHTHNGKVNPEPHTHMMVFLRILHADRLRGQRCVVTINSTRSITFDPNPLNTWVVEFPAGVGEHTVEVTVGDTHTEKTIRIWAPDGAGVVQSEVER